MTCKTPATKKGKDGLIYTFDCGICPSCRNKKATGWAVRLQEEAKRHSLGLFLTLTYSSEHAPISPKGKLTLSHTDWTKFYQNLKDNIKKHNKLNPDKKIPPKFAYFFVGEYGTNTFRPHYHMLIWDVPKKIIEDSWQKGYIHYGHVEGASIGYSLKYIQKPHRVWKNDIYKREPEFQRMSRSIGLNYINDKTKTWHKTDLRNRVYYPGESGMKLPLPRYYKQKLYTIEQRGYLKGHFEKLHFDEEAKKVYFENKGNWQEHFHQQIEYTKSQFNKQLKKAKHGTTI